MLNYQRVNLHFGLGKCPDVWLVRFPSIPINLASNMFGLIGFVTYQDPYGTSLPEATLTVYEYGLFNIICIRFLGGGTREQTGIKWHLLGAFRQEVVNSLYINCAGYINIQLGYFSFSLHTCKWNARPGKTQSVNGLLHIHIIYCVYIYIYTLDIIRFQQYHLNHQLIIYAQVFPDKPHINPKKMWVKPFPFPQSPSLQVGFQPFPVSGPGP